MVARAGRFVVVGNPRGRRVELFQAALAALDLPPARVVPWLDLLAGRAALADVLRAGDILRIESPGRDFEVERAILLAGADAADDGDYARIPRERLEKLDFDKGRILCPRQWYLGFREALQRLERQRSLCPPHALMQHPADILAMFDKSACHERLRGAGIAVPLRLGPVRSYAELVERMRATRCGRVFVKLAHGSSASGAVAYRTNGRRHQAMTTVERVHESGEDRLYNSRSIRTLDDPAAIAGLIDELCRHRVHVERWMPKADVQGKAFDLRVLVIAGRARHVVARLSRSPMTNLHLLNERGDPAAVRARMGPARWDAAMAACEAAMRCFPRSLYGGVDLLIAAGSWRHAVLEVNAFGDLLPGVMCDGADAYAAEIVAAIADPFPTAAKGVPCPS